MTEISYSTAAPAGVAADVLVLPVYEGPEAGPGVRDIKGLDLLALYSEAKLTGKRGETLPVPAMGTLAANRVLLVGLGKRRGVTPDTVRRAVGKIASQLAEHETVATTLAQAGGRSAEDAVQATVEGLLLGSYRFDRYKSSAEDRKKPALRRVVVLGSSRWNTRAAKRAIERAQVGSEAAAWARDLVNTPAKDCPPEFLASQAKKVLGPLGVKVTIWGKAELEKGKMGGILGVGQGSANPPRMIELSYKGAGSARPIALAGKGITFDSGGLSLKDSKNMEWMKGDMAGAAGMLGAVRAIAQLKAKVNVIAAIPASENMPSGSAIRPGDILHHRNGKTSEVLNTDAEGRLVLADALAYLAEKQPRAIVDAATLTGAVVVALGEEVTGVFGNDRRLVREILSAGEAAGEPGWELPLWDGYRRHVESKLADVKNVGNRWGGAITAALFLSEFVGDVPWVHLDVAGPAFAEQPGDYWPMGGTGVPVRTVVRYVLDAASKGGAGRR